MKIIFGYVDPGVGLLLWQTVAAALLGTVFYLRKTREKLLAWCHKLFRINPAARRSPAVARIPRGESRAQFVPAKPNGIQVLG